LRLFAGAPADQTSKYLPGIPLLSFVTDYNCIALASDGMTPLALSMAAGLYRFPFMHSGADRDLARLVSFEELRNWVEQDDIEFLYDFPSWSELESTDMPILSSMADLEPFSYNPYIVSGPDFLNAPLTASVPEPWASCLLAVSLACFAALQRISRGRPWPRRPRRGI
jgi:hypothetical protein